MEKNILLSICIPTYNRAKFLEFCLSRMMSQVTPDLPVEVIVSDNFSTDNTLEVAEKYLKFPNFKLVKQIQNIGPMKNGLELVRVHAKGKFCWYVGDDDYVVPGSIQNILELLKRDVDFVFLNLKVFNIANDLVRYSQNKSVEFEVMDKFENLLLPKYSNIFLGELMGSIFKRELFLKEINIYNKIDDEYLSTLETSYAHCVIFANQFMGKKAIYVKDVMILADFRAREWTEKSAYLVVEQLYNLIQLYKKNGLEKSILVRCEEHYISISFMFFLEFLFNKKSKFRSKISIKRYIAFVLQRPVILTKIIMILIVKKMIKILNLGRKENLNLSF